MLEKMFRWIMGMRKQSESYCTLIQQSNKQRMFSHHGFETCIFQRRDIAADEVDEAHDVCGGFRKVNEYGRLPKPSYLSNNCSDNGYQPCSMSGILICCSFNDDPTERTPCVCMALECGIVASAGHVKAGTRSITITNRTQPISKGWISSDISALRPGKWIQRGNSGVLSLEFGVWRGG